MAKEFIYNKVKEIGKLEENAAVEIGHYKVDGKDMPDKVYLVSHFTRRNGTEDSKARVGRGVAKTLTTAPRQAVYYNGKLRMLTSKEHLRLMGFKDKDYNHMKKNGLTDQQISYLAGNSICIPVLMELYKELMKLELI